MSRNATEGFKDYKALYEMGVNLIYLNKPLINTSGFDSTRNNLLNINMNTKLEMTSVFELSHGNVNSSIVSVREMFQKALLANAVSIILMHNHPSGDSTPSREDIQVTKRAKDAGDLLGVQVLDHIVIGRPGYSSLKEKGYI